ncbi:hypothetical protein [Paenibacillus sp. FSL M7-0831]|uniref:hypothetical protein n=1 Tax=Paenibacillus sp. FSL M7-0831 TaxID=2975314 RepID=UPI0030FC0C53
MQPRQRVADFTGGGRKAVVQRDGGFDSRFAQKPGAALGLLQQLVQGTQLFLRFVYVAVFDLDLELIDLFVGHSSPPFSVLRLPARKRENREPGDAHCIISSSSSRSANALSSRRSPLGSDQYSPGRR